MQAGLKSPDGRAFLEACMVVGQVQPRKFFLENVAAILKHPDWPELERALTQVGMHGPFVTTVDLAFITGTKRNRMISICLKAKPYVRGFLQEWPILRNLVGDMHARFAHCTEKTLKHLKVCQEALAMMQDKKFLPPEVKFKWGGAMNVPDEIVRQLRFIDEEKPASHCNG